MYKWTISFIILAIAAAVLVFGNIVEGFKDMAKVILVLTLVAIVISLLLGKRKEEKKKGAQLP